MNNFYYYNPTKIIFGKNTIGNIGREIDNNSRILILYGQGSIKSNNIYDQVKTALKGYCCYEFGGITANPEYETCVEAISFVKENDIDFLLAVGGGSVIDATKFIALAAYYSSSDEPWDFLIKLQSPPDKALRYGCVLTLPATGSEMNNGFVISRRAINEKVSCSSHIVYPAFSVLDPGVMRSLPRRQLINGIVDMYVHVLEQYITYPTGSTLQDRQAEALLLAILEDAPRLLINRDDYELSSTIMWCAAQALNSNISRGVPTDWATHDIGHQVTALYGLDHAQTLAIILFGVWRNQFDNKKEKLYQYGRRVFNLSGSVDDVASAAIDKTEDFFHEIGMPTKFSDYKLDAEEVASSLELYFKKQNSMLGERNNIDSETIKQILISR